MARNGSYVLPALNDLERRVVEVILNPENSGKSVTEKCEIANCGRQSWYRVLQKPSVVEAINQGSLLLIRDNLQPLVQKTLQYALESKSNHQDRKYLFQLLGMLKNDGATVNVNTTSETVNVAANPFEGLSKEQLDALANQYMADPQKIETDIEELEV